MVIGTYICYHYITNQKKCTYSLIIKKYIVECRSMNGGKHMEKSKFLVIGAEKKEITSLSILFEIFNSHHGTEFELYICNDTYNKNSIKDFDCVFINILMTDNVGIQLAKAIRKDNIYFPIIFLTEKSSLLSIGFEIDILGYLNTPYSYQDFLMLMESISRHLNLFSIEIIDINRIHTKMSLFSIDYVEKVNKHTYIHLLNEKILVTTKSLSYWEEEIKKPFFVKCCRSIIVNILNIEKIDKDYIYTKNRTKIFISRLYLKNVRERYIEFYGKM